MASSSSGPGRSAWKRPLSVASIDSDIDHVEKRQCFFGDVFYLKEHLADVEFELEDRTVPAHRVVLVSSSEVFR
jgi:hypothetical protein